METVKKGSGCLGLGLGGEMNRKCTEDFQGSEITLYGIIMVNTCHCTFVKTYRLYNVQCEPSCKL